MPKSMPRSKQASVCITKHTNFFSLLPTPINLFETTLIDNKQEKSESYLGGACLSPKQNAKTAERVSLQSKYAVQRSVSHSKVNMQCSGACLTPK